MAEQSFEGVLVVDKPEGPTSHDVVATLRRLLRLRRIGHCGTLDPLATGVLVVCLGRFTRLSQWLALEEKEYRAVLRLGVSSDSGDIHGRLLARADAPVPEQEELRRQVRAFEGSGEQVPPAYSAIKVGGVPSYARARRGERVELEARPVHIGELEIEHYAYPQLILRLVCSKGTYVRSLAADLGERLGCGACVEQLRRLRAGRLGLDRALTLDQVEARAGSGDLEAHLVPAEQALADLERVELDEEGLRAFAHGMAVRAPGTAHAICAVFAWEGAFCGIGQRREDGELLRPLRVLRPEVARVAVQGG